MNMLTILNTAALVLMMFAIFHRSSPNRYMYWALVAVCCVGAGIIRAFNHEWVTVLVNAITIVLSIFNARFAFKQTVKQ
jgi:hypothetical protein